MTSSALLLLVATVLSSLVEGQIECRQGEVYYVEIPESCQQFYRCNNGVAELMKCSNGNFNPATSACYMSYECDKEDKDHGSDNGDRGHGRYTNIKDIGRKNDPNTKKNNREHDKDNGNGKATGSEDSGSKHTAPRIPIIGPIIDAGLGILG